MKTKTILQTLILLFFVFAANAQRGINYKAIINDAKGAAIVNTEVTVQFTILENGTKTVYKESHNPSTDINGIIIVNLGEGNVVGGVFEDIDWGSNPHFLKTEINTGSGLTDMGTTEFKAVPYALHAKTAGNAATKADVTLTVSAIGDSLFMGTEQWVIVPGISAANSGGGNTTYGTVTDIDGNIYNTIEIGTQTWMAENLRTTRYNTGTAIPLVTDNSTWESLYTPAYSWYNNDQATYGLTYGALYNWYTVDIFALCPTGWHVPSDEEWTTLTNYLGGESLAGGKMKETGTTHWISPNTGATNASGFTALPGGSRDENGNFYGIGDNGNWWSTTEHTEYIILKNPWYRQLISNTGEVGRNTCHKQYGFSVRCLKY